MTPLLYHFDFSTEVYPCERAGSKHVSWSSNYATPSTTGELGETMSLKVGVN